MKCIGISGSLLLWFSSYLSNRRQRVVLPRASSSWEIIHAGVPQGSILGPLLFLVYINDITNNIGSNIRLFADDTTLYLIINDPIISATIIESDLQTISDWAKKWLVTFNPTKTESLLITRKNNRSVHPHLLMMNQRVTEVETHKHLGITFETRLTWHTHINLILEKAWKRIHIMRKLKYTLDRDSLQTIYFSFIRPVLEYADVVWGNCTQYETDEIEKIQNEAGRIVTGATKLISLDKLQQETGWESLSSRRKCHRLILFYKMVNQQAPSYLTALLPDKVGNRSQYSLRNENNYQTIACKTALYSNSFLPATIQTWNSLPEDIKNSPSLYSFKQKLKHKIEVPNFFRHGCRQGQLLLTRIRTNCSALNNDLVCKNISQSSLCTCGAVEDSFHFFFQCRNYNEQRLELLDKISQICIPSLQHMLYGNKYLNEVSQKKLSEAVHKYIISTKRFNR